jgi:hypothetical protein
MMAKKKRVKIIEAIEKNSITPNATAPERELQSSPEIDASAVSVQERIQLLAYSYWEQRGDSCGSPEEDWYRAEQEILSQMNVVE